MRSVEEALKTVLDSTKVLGTERIAIQDAHGGYWQKMCQAACSIRHGTIRPWMDLQSNGMT